ncbi:TetR family transcriptional regulator [Micromonospora fluostatini]|uniref:TetR family transcriptional regulator n=1 Tax=Micromonospora fluostatini TaxID=1629071 RepID=A0ABY2DEK0_9ACTN|nr:TetR family transcriptional regulator [Micromonospora fluostatini]
MSAADRPRRAVRPRDPEGRRRAILAAALEVIAEVGVGRTTHRAVAGRAGVPLGATTYYFPSLADLVAAALAQAHADLDVELGTWAAHLGDGTDLPARLTRLLCGYLADRGRALTEFESYLAAARDPELRGLAMAWVDTLRQVLTPLVGDEAARSVVALLDGVALQHLATGDPFDTALVEAAVTALTTRPPGR